MCRSFSARGEWWRQGIEHALRLPTRIAARLQVLVGRIRISCKASAVKWLRRFSVSGEWSRKRIERARRLPTRIRTRVPALVGRIWPGREPSLVNRLSAFLLMGAITIYLIVVASLYFTSSRLVEENLRKHVRQWIADMDELATPLYFSRDADLSHIENRIKNISDISFVRYYDGSGKRILGQVGQYHDKPLRPLTDEQIEKLAAIVKSDTPYLFDTRDSDYVHVISSVRVRSIRSDGLFNFDLDSGVENVKIIGYIDLAIDPRSYRAQLLKSFAFGSGLIAVLLFLVIIGGRRLIRKALHPLTDLQTPLKRLANGEIDIHVKTGGDREIAAIADALNVTIGALKERNEALVRSAERDSVTGLYNRSYFSRALDAELVWAKRAGRSSALMFVDLDRFKFVNDMLGHAAGDRLLVKVADRLKARMRHQDVISRFGGDEFTVIAHDVTREDAINVARSIHDILLDYHFVEQGQSFTISCTIGIVMITPDSGDVEEVLLQADSACSNAKAAGRNRYFLHEPGRQQRLETATYVGWSQLIKDAIKEDWFTLVYQPIVSIAGHKQDFYEVLLRVPDKSGKLMLPELFLPVAERFGQLAEIDRWVITHALKALAQFRRRGRDIVFSINLSGQSLTDPAIVELIRNSLTLNALPPSSVIFEITEQTAVRYIDRARDLTQSLIDLGCRFALDDFGVGFSSFSYLKRLPVSWIKIDGSFIEHLPSELVDQLMVKAIAQVAKALGKEVVAEFVQDEATIGLLRRYGVDFVQGYHVGRPSEVLPHRASLLLSSPDRKRSDRSRKVGI